MSRAACGALLLLGLITVARLIFAASFPPLDDEAYYWTWARHLAWGYPDHPPMIAYVVRLTTTLVGNSALGIRLGPVLLALGTALLLWDSAARMFGGAAGTTAALWFQLVPALALGAVFAAPDAPLGFFWMLTLWAFWRALSGGSLIAWLGAGLALGLAMISKLTAAFLALALLAFLLASPAHRSWFRRAEPYLAALLSVLVILPTVVWNAHNRWILIQKSTHPAPWTDLSSGLLNMLSYTAGQLVYYGPGAAVLLIVALAVSVGLARHGDSRFALAAWAGVPIVAIDWLASVKGIPKPHWPAPGYLVALLPAAALWQQINERRVWRAIAGIAIGLNLLIVGTIHVLPFVSSPVAGQVWGWDQVASRLETIIDETPASSGVFILSGSYQTAAQIDYHTRGRYEVVTANRTDAFGVRGRLKALAGWNAVFLNDVAATPGLPLDRMFRRIERLPNFDVVHNGQVVRHFAVYRCFGFQGSSTP